METTELVYFEDVLVQTKTRRSDWIVGLREIGEYMGGSTYYAKMKSMAEAGEIPVRKVRNSNPGSQGRYAHQWIALIADLDKWKAAHQPKIETPPPEPPSTNGHKTETIILKEGSPLLSQQDMDRLVSTMWRMIEAIKANTEEIKKMREAWEK